MDVERDGGRVWPWGQGVEGSGLFRVEVHAVLLHSLSLRQTSALLPGLNGVLEFDLLLKPEAVVPTPPDLVIPV